MNIPTPPAASINIGSVATPSRSLTTDGTASLGYALAQTFDNGNVVHSVYFGAATSGGAGTCTLPLDTLLPTRSPLLSETLTVGDPDDDNSFILTPLVSGCSFEMVLAVSGQTSAIVSFGTGETANDITVTPGAHARMQIVDTNFSWVTGDMVYAGLVNSKPSWSTDGNLTEPPTGEWHHLEYNNGPMSHDWVCHHYLNGVYQNASRSGVSYDALPDIPTWEEGVTLSVYASSAQQVKDALEADAAAFVSVAANGALTGEASSFTKTYFSEDVSMLPATAIDFESLALPAMVGLHALIVTLTNVSGTATPAATLTMGTVGNALLERNLDSDHVLIYLTDEPYGLATAGASVVLTLEEGYSAIVTVVGTTVAEPVS